MDDWRETAERLEIDLREIQRSSLKSFNAFNSKIVSCG